MKILSIYKLFRIFLYIPSFFIIDNMSIIHRVRCDFVFDFQINIARQR